MTNTAKPSDLPVICHRIYAKDQKWSWVDGLPHERTIEDAKVCGWTIVYAVDRAAIDSTRPPLSEQAGDCSTLIARLEDYEAWHREQSKRYDGDNEHDALASAYNVQILEIRRLSAAAPAKPCDAEDNDAACDAAFNGAMAGRQYGLEETDTARAWFECGWRLAQPQRQGLMSGQLHDEVVNFITDHEEDVTHQRLIAIGWTPPTEQPASAAVDPALEDSRRLIVGFMLDCNAIGLTGAAENLHKGIRLATASEKIK